MSHPAVRVHPVDDAGTCHGMGRFAWLAAVNGSLSAAHARGCVRA